MTAHGICPRKDDQIWNNSIGHSLFVIGNRELIMDLLFERVVFFLYMDFEKFFALAAKEGVTLRWATCGMR